MPLFVGVDRWVGEAYGAEGQEVMWVTASELTTWESRMPPADVLLLPAVRNALLRAQTYARRRKAAAAPDIPLLAIGAAAEDAPPADAPP